MKVFAAISIMFLTLQSCSPNEISIGNGLKIVDLSYRNLTIIDNNGNFLIYPKITYYCKK